MLSTGNTLNPNALSVFSSNVTLGQPAVSVNTLLPMSMSSSTVALPNVLQNTSIGMPQFNMLPVTQSTMMQSPMMQNPQNPMMQNPHGGTPGGTLGGMVSQLESSSSIMMQCASMLKSLLGNYGCPQPQTYAPSPAPSYPSYPQQPVPYTPPSYTPPVSYNPMPMPGAMPGMPPCSYLPTSITQPMSQIPTMMGQNPMMMSQFPGMMAPQVPQVPMLPQVPMMPQPIMPDAPQAANIPPYFMGGSSPVCPAPIDPTAPYEAPVYNGGNGGQYWGDPHLVGFDGEKYDVMGQGGKIYNMLSDKNLQYNTKFERWGSDDATVIGEAAMQVGNNRVFFDRSGKAPTVDGKPMTEGQSVALGDGSSAKWDGKKLTVTTPEYTINLEVKEPNNPKGAYLDSHVTINDGGPFSDFVAPHGLLGQTADGIKGLKDTGRDQGKQGGTVIDGTVNDYEVSDLWNTDDKFNRFGIKIGKVIENPMDGTIDKVLDTEGNVIFQATPADKS